MHNYHKTGKGGQSNRATLGQPQERRDARTKLVNVTRDPSTIHFGFRTLSLSQKLRLIFDQIVASSKNFGNYTE